MPTPSATLEKVEYPVTDLSIRALTPRQIADELLRRAPEYPYARGVVASVRVATTQFSDSARSELLLPKHGTFIQHVISAVSGHIDSRGMLYWTGARIIKDDGGKISLEVHIRI
jgi:hypothetical protein